MRCVFYIELLWLTAVRVSGQSLPTVDLGYEVHQAISFNSSGQYYNFSNIRYAQPPVGDLRFAAPVAPTGRNPAVQNGSVGAICPQASPAWSNIAVSYLESLIFGIPFNYTAALQGAQNALPTPTDPRTTEDCLFLDVMAPKAIFDNAKRRKKRAGQGAPVLVWIYGGGYTEGDKTGSGDPAGLIKASQKGIIFVALNYRLGALGWLGGPSLQANGTANAALYDQRLALEWVQNNIHIFGGDPSRVTVIGESAGGGSIMHQITAYGGLKPVPFQQAILQSPAFLSIQGNNEQENATQNFLDLLGVTTIQEARSLSSEAVIAANTKQIAAAPYGFYGFGPAVDGLLVPALPGKLLLQGSFAKNLKVMVGHNSDEGPYFTNPAINTTDDMAAQLRQNYPGISDAVLFYILQEMYPATYDGSRPYTDQSSRTITLIEEASFTCNTNYLDRAFANQTYTYQFSVTPGFHGFDIAYTFYNGGGKSSSVSSPDIALAMQAYFTSFAETGVPKAPGQPDFPMYGSDSTILNFNSTGITTMKDPTANERCYWWQKALYF